ncbi:hypothetical protein PG990_004808 [Apiospora arundinis]
MVALGRLRKSKSPAVLGSPIAEDIIPPQRPVSPQLSTTPTPRNFSYPIGIPIGPRAQKWVDISNQESPIYDQVGETSRPPFSGPKGRTWPEIKSVQLPHVQSHKQDGKSTIRYQFDQLDLGQPSSKESANIGKKHRRSTLLSLSASYTRSTASIGDLLASADTREPTPKASKEPKAHFFGDFTLPHKSSRFKRNSLVQHKPAASFDASQLVRVYTASPQRPVSSYQTFAPAAKAPELGVETFPLYTWEHIGDERISRVPLAEYYSAPKTSRMDPRDSKAAAMERRSSSGGRKRGNSTSEVDKRKGKEGKGRWLSQLKEWVSASEPSTQAFKQHKKDTYKRAGIALDDPRAGAKLHIPTTTLPSDAIKPYGRGPEPEEMARRNTENKKRLRKSFSTAGTSQGSRSSTSQHSSMSSLPMNYLREDA